MSSNTIPATTTTTTVAAPTMPGSEPAALLKPLQREVATLGRTGLKVSRLAFGVATFGWGQDNEEEARKMYKTYRAAGGNFLDTANIYGGGTSEEWLGKFVEEEGTRDSVVISTKYTFGGDANNVNGGGNGRKSLLRSLERSLQRLRTSYVDVLFLHVYDLHTPVEEVMSTLNDVVRAGKVLHIGLSDVPAWYAAQAQTIARLRGWEPVAVLQLEYSLASRSLEREHLGMAREMGISLMPWSPLASGLLTGKYTRNAKGEVEGAGRLLTVDLPFIQRVKKNPQAWEVVTVLTDVAAKLGRTPAEVALAWVLQRPQVATVCIGATHTAQLEANLAAVDLTLPAEVVARLDEASKLEPTELDSFFTPQVQASVHGPGAIKRGA
jgi:aryl-alcohol dehydrogenase-like predicted oxidoreductase